MKYVKPTTLEELSLLLKTSNGVSHVLAGGTDLVPRYEQGADLPDLLIDVKAVNELKGIDESNGAVEIGSLTTLSQILENDDIRDRYTSLHQAARDFAAVQIRNRATIGGNICTASPAGDLLPPLYAIGAQLKISSGNGERTLPIIEFIKGPGNTDLRKGEFLRSVILPGDNSISLFVKLGLREAMAISVLSYAIRCRIEGGRFTLLNIAAGAVAPTVRMLTSCTDAILKDSTNLAAAVSLVDMDIAPIDDIRASAGYRRKAIARMLRASLEELLEKSDE